MFKFIYSFITDTFGIITGNVFCDFVLVFIISQLLYPLAYQITGDAYESGIIGGSSAGSLLHWILRGIFFILVAYCLKGLIWMYATVENFIESLPSLWPF